MKKKEFTINQVCGEEVNSKVQALSQYVTTDVMVLRAG